MPTAFSKDWGLPGFWLCNFGKSIIASGFNLSANRLPQAFFSSLLSDPLARGISDDDALLG
jgi:hypothetical protein